MRQNLFMAIPMVQLDIPRAVLSSARLTVEELKVELAVHLYQQRRLSLGKACELAGLSVWRFRQILGARQIEATYDPEDVDEDLRNLRALDLL